MRSWAGEEGEEPPRTALESILTNRHYLGWRIVQGQVANKTSHEPLIERRLFEFAFTTLTGRDVEGNAIEQAAKPRRYYQKTTSERVSLLKDRIQGGEGKVYVKSDRRYDLCTYMYLPKEHIHQPTFTNKGHIEIIKVEQLDDIVVERLFFHIKKNHQPPRVHQGT